MLTGKAFKNSIRLLGIVIAAPLGFYCLFLTSNNSERKCALGDNVHSDVAINRVDRDALLLLPGVGSGDRSNK
jgi:hypothetical protein